MDSNFLRLPTRTTLALVISCLALASCSSSAVPPAITADELNQRSIQESVTIIDTRPSTVFDAKHINKGKSICEIDLDYDFQSTPQALIVISGDGSADPGPPRLAAKLKARGYTNVRILEGGFPAWEAAGFSTRTIDDIPMVARPYHSKAGINSVP
jgi:rhodanese-related sulfurtransferase